MPDVLEVRSDDATVEVVQPLVQVVEVVTEGPQGPVGPVADLNLVLGAVDEAVSDYFVLHPQSFVYDQGTEVFLWDIVHPLDHRPAVVVTDSAGTVWRGAVDYPVLRRVTIGFNVALAGRATLS